VLIDLVLKLAFPIRVVAHSTLSTGLASKGDRHAVRKAEHRARAWRRVPLVNNVAVASWLQ